MALHFAAGGSATEVASAGFNLVDVQYIDQVNELPDGMKAMVWLNEGEGVTQSFIDKVTPFLGNPKVYGFFLVDEPDPTGQYHTQVDAEDLKAESDWIHARMPDAKTFITAMDMGSAENPDFSNTYNYDNTHIDLFGISAYPVRTGTDTVDYDMIDRTVAAAVESGIPVSQIVPVHQTFGGGNWTTNTGGKYVMPTADQLQTMMDHWNELVPSPEFDFAYAWGSQEGDVALESSPELQAVFREHNLSTTGTVASDVIDDSSTATVPADATISDDSAAAAAASDTTTSDDSSTATTASDTTASDDSSTAAAASDTTVSDDSSTVAAASGTTTSDDSATAAAASGTTTSDDSATAAAASDTTTSDDSSTAAAAFDTTISDDSATATPASDTAASDGSSTETAASRPTTSNGGVHAVRGADATHAAAGTDRAANHDGNDTSHVDNGGEKAGSSVDRVLAALSGGSESLAGSHDKTAGNGFAHTVEDNENVGANASKGGAAEIMSGRAGHDAFDFSWLQEKLQDKPHFDQAFLDGLKSGGESSDALSTAAHDRSDQVSYDSSTGSLSLDSDGTGDASQTQVASHFPWQHHSL
ncbi:MAG: calcium-binding protein [Mesorhizobium sp.]|uniref:calcium-binding protein n=1 Tax=Mesorhizobium sp. TaxID=1871066 RepID=UPI000FEA1BB9|nr:calcium-binding protein [Mesorhizobium sp.]RWE09526.1 MAG: calcium-binding protein [Mesorhizobium sp.]RWH57550.1 MAG: calcium-binding protein [Mesorhizobium sp.]RWJ30445.1 MAG: calcium-binding protein [Mesorhizobium sp.]RWJ41633.1 MAG: calcium-binding protein [Mesorhizobium sp.]